MTVYNWSALANNQKIAFNPSTDKLTFDSSAISAASMRFLPMSGVTSVYSFADPSGKVVILSTDLRALTTSNVVFADGSQQINGDNSTGVSLDDAANTILGTPKDDLLFGFGSSDTISSGDGNDTIIASDITGASGVDSIDGGNGFDLVVYRYPQSQYTVTAQPPR